jgi:Flp pilus assembly protein TadG
MRVRRFSLIRVRHEEQGAVLAIVAISLICLIGMLVLTFDLGRGVALKRNMVNGADAAALAAARECGLAHGDVAAKQAATTLVADNNDAATLLPDPDGFEVDPEGAQCNGTAGSLEGGVGLVTVTVRVPQQYFFAPIFGINNGTVVASATAEWTTGLTNPAPVKIDQLKVEQCVDEGQPNPEGMVDCWFTFAKGPGPLNSDWGWLNLPEGWPVKGQDPNPMKCSSQAGGAKDLGDYIGGMGGMGAGGAALPPLWDETGGGNPPTWVCSATGHKASNVEDIQQWVDDVQALMNQVPPKLESEPVVLFPIVACNGAVAPCHPWLTTPGVAYPVVKLQGFFVKEALDGKAARNEPNCHFTRKSSDVFCLHLQTTGLDDSSSGGRPIVRLVD